LRRRYPAGATPSKAPRKSTDKLVSSIGPGAGPEVTADASVVHGDWHTTVGNAFGGKSPIIGLFDWRPKDIDEALVVAESDDNGKTWFFMQTVLELFPDLTNPVSGGFSATATATGCPPTVESTNASSTSANGSTADDGWGTPRSSSCRGPAT
jgi:hypothetical protein